MDIGQAIKGIIGLIILAAIAVIFWHVVTNPGLLIVVVLVVGGLGYFLYQRNRAKNRV